MKLTYYPEPILCISDFSEPPSVESREISEGVVLDYDAEGKLVDIDIDIDIDSHKVELKALVLSTLPGKVEMAAA